MRIVFWSSIAVILYTYAGYPLVAVLFGRYLGRRVDKGRYEPTVSIVIAARNEAAHLRATLDNKRRLDYPQEKLQIIVVSDASTDGTDEIAREYAGERVLVLRQCERRGKTAALTMAVPHATGEIVVFSDANSLFDPDALRALVQNFRDPKVGYVTGRMEYGDTAGSAASLGCRLYMAYEDVLRRAETLLGSIVGVNGGIDAMRRALFRPMRDDQLPDFILPLRVVQDGYRVVYEPAAILREDALTTVRAEYRMRVRVTLRAWWTLAEMRALFNVRLYGPFAIQLFSHKVLRYVVFAAGPVLYVSAMTLRNDGAIYQLAFLGTSAILALAAAGSLTERTGRSRWPLGIPYDFLLVNAAAAHALWSFLRGRRQTVWTPRLG